MLRKKVLLGCALVAALAAPIAGGEKTRSATGWISDENCGARHMKPGGADCIRKCWKGGADIGHPEWKPQRAVFVSDAEKKVWVVENPEAVRNQAGQHVRLTGRFDATSVHVEQVTPLGANEEKK